MAFNRRRLDSHTLSSANEKSSRLERLQHWLSARPKLRQFGVAELLSANMHADDFSATRAQNLIARIRGMTAILAVLVILWMLLDYIALDEAHFTTIGRIRLSFGFLLGAMSWWQYQNNSLQSALRRLMLLVFLLSVFFIVISLALVGNEQQGALIGYSYLPFLVITALTIFPLTLIEGASLTLLIAGSTLFVHIYNGSVFSPQAYGDLWLLFLFVIITLCSQAAQLHLLLKLHQQDTHDQLTGLLNRRGLLQILQNQKNRRKMSVLLLDLDGLKQINDLHGYHSGDAVLKNFAGVVKRTLRASDLSSRFGGDELVVILSDISDEYAANVAERIRDHCQLSMAKGENNIDLPYSCSIGLTHLKPNERIEHVINRAADALLYTHQQERGRIVSIE